MKQRGDLDCLHEPFGEAWYQGEDPLWHRFRPGSKTTRGLTIESVWQDIQDRATRGPVFIKDFPHYISHRWDREFLSCFVHAFLIRDPALTITSMHDKWPDFNEGEVGFAEQRALFDLLHALHGTPPPVFDSSDLLEDPPAMVKAFCHNVGIPFIESALSWEAGADLGDFSWWDGGAFHKNLQKSTGLKAQARKYVELDSLPEKVKQVYKRQIPHYRHLAAHRVFA